MEPNDGTNSSRKSNSANKRKYTDTPQEDGGMHWLPIGNRDVFVCVGAPDKSTNKISRTAAKPEVHAKTAGTPVKKQYLGVKNVFNDTMWRHIYYHNGRYRFCAETVKDAEDCSEKRFISIEEIDLGVEAAAKDGRLNPLLYVSSLQYDRAG